MYQIIFLDIDGTLRDELYGIPETSKKAIKLCKKNRVLVCLCTGRTIATITDDVLDLNVDGIIAGGGCYIEFKKKILKNKFFPIDTINNVFYYLTSQVEKTAFTFETKTKVFMNEQARKILENLNEKKFKDLDLYNITKNEQKIVYEDNMYLFKADKFPVSKICLWSNNIVFEKTKSILSDMQIAQTFPVNSKNYYEIIQNNCNKGQATEELCNYLNIPKNDTIVFGDAKNDIDMFINAGTSVAMKNGDPEALNYADSICEETIKDGIFNELRRRKII